MNLPEDYSSVSITKRPLSTTILSTTTTQKKTHIILPSPVNHETPSSTFSKRGAIFPSTLFPPTTLDRDSLLLLIPREMGTKSMATAAFPQQQCSMAFFSPSTVLNPRRDDPRAPEVNTCRCLTPDKRSISTRENVDGGRGISRITF